MIGRTNAVGGTGGILTVIAPAGQTVTVSKDGKTKTKVAGLDGVAVFKGLSSGVWTVSIADGDKTTLRQVAVISEYSTTISFLATISVTYPAGSACTATDGVTTLSAPDTSGAWACVVPNTGTWTFTCTDGDKTASKSVEITGEGQSESVSLEYVIQIVTSGVIGEIGFSTNAYNASRPAEVTNGDGYIRYTCDGGYTAAIVADSKIDLTSYTKITATLDVIKAVTTSSLSSNLRGASVVVMDSISNSSMSVLSSAIVASAQTTTTGDGQELALDVSEITGEYYVGIVVGAYSSSSGDIRLRDLEVS